jgi:hypothetical protein
MGRGYGGQVSQWDKQQQPMTAGTPKPSGGYESEIYQYLGVVPTGNRQATNFGTNVVYYQPFTIDTQITITDQAVHCNVAGTAGALCRVIIASADSEWQPIDLLHEFATLDTTSTGTKVNTGLSVSLSPGRYLVGWRTEVATSSLVHWALAWSPWHEVNMTSGAPRQVKSVSHGGSFSPPPKWTTNSVNTYFPVTFRWTA